MKGRWLEKEAALMIQCLMTPVELCNPDFRCGTCRSTRDGQWFVLRARSVFAFCPPPDWGGQWAACVAAQWRPAAVWSWWSLASLSGGHLPPYYLHPPPLHVLQAVFHLFLSQQIGCPLCHTTVLSGQMAHGWGGGRDRSLACQAERKYSKEFAF